MIAVFASSPWADRLAVVVVMVVALAYLIRLCIKRRARKSCGSGSGCGKCGR